MPRTNADKRKAVMTLLGDDEWRQWSDREIARRVGVAADTVGDVRRSLSKVDSEDSPRTYLSKHGTVSTMHTANIGKKTLGPDKSRAAVAQRRQDIRSMAGQAADDRAHVEVCLLATFAPSRNP